MVTCDYHTGLFALVHARWDTHLTETEKTDWADGIAEQCPRCCGLPEQKHVPREMEEP